MTAETVFYTILHFLKRRLKTIVLLIWTEEVIRQARGGTITPSRWRDGLIYASLYFSVGTFLVLGLVCIGGAFKDRNVESSDRTRIRGDEGGPASADEESLTLESESRSEDVEHQSRTWGSCFETFESALLFPGSVFICCFYVRPVGSSIIWGSLAVLWRVAINAGIAVFAPLLLTTSPLIIIWIVFYVRAVEEHNPAFYFAWARRAKTSLRVVVCAFVGLLVLEGTVLVQPLALANLMPQLFSRTTLLATAFKWLGFTTYPIAIMWFASDGLAAYLMDRIMAMFVFQDSALPSAAPQPWGRIQRCMRFIFLPGSMISNACIFAAPFSTGFISASATIASITGGVFLVLALDLLCYWPVAHVYMRYCISVHPKSPLDSLAFCLMLFVGHARETGTPETSPEADKQEEMAEAGKGVALTPVSRSES